jgi:hypothetical protein
MSNLFEVLEPNLMELNLSELTSFNSIQFNLINHTNGSKQLGWHGYHEHKQSKPTV